MSQPHWTARAGTVFQCETRPATGARGMVVTNDPLARPGVRFRPEANRT